MPAERRTFNDQLEPIIYWDTTFSIAFTDNTHGTHGDCRAFALRLEAEGSLSVASDFTYNELNNEFRIKRIFFFPFSSVKGAGAETK